MCCSHAAKVEAYIKESRWSKAGAPFSITTIALPDTMSVGEVLRDLDGRGIMRGDFVLVSGDVVGNIDFQKVLAAHNERKKTDKNAIMTMVLREASPLHRTRPRTRPGVFVLDNATGRCLRYADPGMGDDKLAVDAELFGEFDEVAFRNDLIDCRLDICTIDVPALFTENFDYNQLRSDFVKGILTSDLLGKTIYTHIVDSGYAARVSSLQTYDAISRDIVSRYTYPISIESNLLDDQCYSYQKGHIYKEDGVVLAQSCHIGAATVLGAGTQVADGARVAGSVVGRRCVIGKDARVSNSYVWDDVVIEDGAVVDSAIVANGAVIRSGAKLEPGSIVSYGVVVGEGQRVPGKVRLTLQGRADADESELDHESAQVVGPDGRGHVFHDSDLSDDDVSDDDEEQDSFEHAADGLVYSMDDLHLSDTSIESVRQSSSKRAARHVRTLSGASVGTASSDENDEETFYREAVASIDRSIREHHAQDIALLELNTLRMTMNAAHEEVRTAALHSLVSHISKLVSTGTEDVKPATTKVFGEWTYVIRKITFDDDDQVDLLLKLQRECARLAPGPKILFYAADTLYENDVVAEENIYRWWALPEGVETEQMRDVRSIIGKWVEWLQTAEEESDDE